MTRVLIYSNIHIFFSHLQNSSRYSTAYSYSKKGVKQSTLATLAITPPRSLTTLREMVLVCVDLMRTREFRMIGRIKSSLNFIRAEYMLDIIGAGATAAARLFLVAFHFADPKTRLRQH